MSETQETQSSPTDEQSSKADPPSEETKTPTVDPPKEDPPKESAKPGEDEVQPPKAAAIEKDALVIPEGFEVDDKRVQEFLAVVNDEKLEPAERVNKLVSMHADAMKAASERNSALWQEMQDKWVEEARNDPKIGGAKMDATLASVAKVLDAFPDGDKLREVMDITGAGNHPAMIKFLHWLSPHFAEGEPTPAGGQPAGEKTLADKLFG